jgi:hypothetical protein
VSVRRRNWTELTVCGSVRGMGNDIDDILDVVTRRLPAAGIACVMIGGHAVNHYGVTRATQDIDFMIASGDADAVRRIMYAAGFTNISAHETVMFFNRPGTPLRVDFLKTDQETVAHILAHAVSTPLPGGRVLVLPCLRDLLAMKVFALASGGPGRRDKDFLDIVHLVLENDVDVEHDLQALCREYGADAFFDGLRARIEELRYA